MAPAIASERIPVLAGPGARAKESAAPPSPCATGRSFRREPAYSNSCYAPTRAPPVSGEARILGLESESATAARRPRLLFVLHSFHIRAGTEEHTRILAEALCDRFDIAYLFPESGAVVLRLHDSASEIRFPGGPLRY